MKSGERLIKTYSVANQRARLARSGGSDGFAGGGGDVSPGNRRQIDG